MRPASSVRSSLRSSAGTWRRPGLSGIGCGARPLCSTRLPVIRLPVPVRLATVRDPVHRDGLLGVVDLVDDAVLADADAPVVAAAGELHRAGGSGLAHQGDDPA